MKLEFSKSGGFAGAMAAVKGVIASTGSGAEITSPEGYHRALTADEAAEVRTAADPAVLAQAAGEVGSKTRGAADLDHYQITMTGDDGTKHQIDLNTSGASSELQGVAPAVAGLVRLIREESKSILSHRRGRSVSSSSSA